MLRHKKLTLFIISYLLYITYFCFYFQSECFVNYMPTGTHIIPHLYHTCIWGDLEKLIANTHIFLFIHSQNGLYLFYIFIYTRTEYTETIYTDKTNIYKTV